MSRVVVLGGGPAGLYAALLLARRDIPVTVLEREEVPGGLTAGTELNGFAVDFGSHRLHPSTDPDILEDLRGLLGDDLQTRRRNGRIHLDGRWISFPIAPTELLTRLRPRTIGRLGTGAVRAVVTARRTATFADVVSTGLGDGMGELFYYPYARKIWGVDASELSGEQARRRISADSPWKLVAKAFSGRGTGGHFFYPRHGFGQIASALASAAARAGADIRLGTEVVAVTASGGGLEVKTREHRIEAGLVLSTIPVTVLSRFLDPPQRVREAVDSLRYRAMALVFLEVPDAQWTPYDAHYFPGADIPFTRVSEPKNYRVGPDPADRSVICVEIPCDPGDTTWDRDDGELISDVRRHVVALGLPDPGVRGRVRRIRHAYPIYRVGAEDVFERVAAWLDGVTGVVSYGRQGLFAHDNTHHAMAMARDAVACVSDSLVFDAEEWRQARERFGSHIVED